MKDILFIPDFSTPLAAGSTALPSSDIFSTSVHGDLSRPPVFLNHNTPADNRSQLRIGDISIKSDNPAIDSCSLHVSRSSQPNLSAPGLPKSAPLPQSEQRSFPPTVTQLLPEEGIQAPPGLAPLERSEVMVQHPDECKTPMVDLHRLKDRVRHKRMANKKLALRTSLEAKLSQQEIASIRTQSTKCAPPDKREKYDILMKYFKDHPNEPLTKKYPLDFLCSSVINKKKNDFEGIEREQLTVLKKKIVRTFSYVKCQRIDKRYISLLKRANGIPE